MSAGVIIGGRSALWLLAPIAALGACWALAPEAVEPIDERAYLESARMEQQDDGGHRLARARGVAEGEDAEAARARTERVLGREGIESPMLARPEPAPEPEPEPRVGPQPAPEPETPEFQISSIIAGSSGAICVIDGRPLRAGDRVKGDWFVRSIDVAARRVVVEGPGDRMVELTQGPRSR